MDENNDAATESAKTRGRPVGAKTKRVRRNFSGELLSLQSRVEVAVRLLRKCSPSEVSDNALVNVAIETLEGQP